MSEEERLELTSAVKSSGYEELDRLADELEETDDQIRQAGRGQDRVIVDVDTRGVARAATEMEALDAAVDDLETDLQDIGDLETEPIEEGGEGGGDVAGAGSLHDLFDDAESVGSQDITSDTRTFDAPDEITTTHADVDATHADVDSGTALASGGVEDLLGNERARDALFGPGGQSIDDAMDMPDLFADRRDPQSFRGTLAKAKQELVDFRFTASKLHNAFAALYPLAGLLVGALPAAITGVAALGAAALTATGALAGIGALGAMGVSLQRTGQVSAQPIANELQQVQSAFVEAFGPLSREFAPLVVDAIDSVEAMMGPLAQASQGLLMFRDDFRAVVDFVTTNLPAAVSSLLAFGHAITPLVGDIVSFIAEKDILGFLAAQLSQALPALKQLGALLVELLPAIVRVSQGFLTFVGTLSMVVTPVVKLINSVPLLAKGLGILAGTLLFLTTATTLYSIATSGAIGSALTFIVTLGGLISVSEMGTLSMIGLATATIAFASVLAAVLLPLLSQVVSDFFGLNQQLEKARKNLEKFRRERDRIANGSMGVGGVGGRTTVYEDNSTTVIEAGDPHDAARQQYSAAYEQSQHVDSVFGG